MELESALSNSGSISTSTSTTRRGRKGKRLRCDGGDGAEEGGRHRKKSKTFDTSGSKLVSMPSTSSAAGGVGVEMQKQKRRIRSEAEPLTPNNSSSKLFKAGPDDGKTDASKIEAMAARKKSNPAVTIEDIGSEEAISSEYRDPLAAADGDDESEISDTDNQSCEDDEEDSNSEGNWKNEYPDEASDFEHDYDRECSSSDVESNDDEESQRFRSFNRKVTDKDIADCSSKLGKMLRDFHKERGPIQVIPDSSCHASYSLSNPLCTDLSDDEDEDYFGGTRGHSKSRFLDDGLADEVVSSASESD